MGEGGKNSVRNVDDTRTCVQRNRLIRRSRSLTLENSCSIGVKSGL